MNVFVNFLKSQFIGMYMMSAMAVGIYALYQLVSVGFTVEWLGVVLVTMPIVMLISYLMMFRNVARTSIHFPYVSLLALVGATLSTYSIITQNGEDIYLPAYFGVGGYIAFMVYNYWYSNLGRKKNPALKVGEFLSNFKCHATNGALISSEDLKGNPGLYIFYRGNWCPLCMAQIKEIATKYQRLNEMGINVMLISPQPEQFTKALAKKYDVDFKFLTDKNNTAAKQLGIYMPQGLPFGMQMFGFKSDTVFPTIIATDAEGRIIFSDETDNYRVRPEPSTFIKIFENL